MSFSPRSHGLNGARATINGAALAILTTIALGATGVSAVADPMHYRRHSVNADEFLAHSSGALKYCVPVNGAQILGGFAGPDDRLDPATGDICNR